MPPTLTITPIIVTLDVGESVQLTVSPNANGVKWTCDQCHIAKVDNNGLVTGLAFGNCIITGRRGNQSVSVSVTVIDVDPPPEPVPDPPTIAFSVVNGQTVDDLWRFSYLGTAAGEGDSIVQSVLNFGDGTPIETFAGLPVDDDIVHEYALQGDYTLTWSIETAFGYIRSMEFIVTVQPGPTPPDPPDPPQPPTATLSFLSGQFTGQPITFAASGADTDGTIVAHRRDFGDGTVVTEAGEPPAILTHSYVNPGTYTVTLTVTDNTGLIGTTSVNVVIEQAPTQPQPPTAILQHLAGAFAGDQFAFSTVGSFDPDGPLASWSFQAGNGLTQQNTGAPPSQISSPYPSAGTFTARLTVTDGSGLQDTADVVVVVSTAPTSGTYPYFVALVARPDRMYAWPLRSQAELDSYETGGNWAPVGSVFYDAVVDACQQFVHPGVILGPSGRVGTGNTPRQKFLPMVVAFGTSFLQTWDARYTAGFAWLGATYLKGYKSYRWDLPKSGPTPAWIAQNDSWQTGSVHAALGWRFVKVPTNPYWALPPTTVGSQESIQPQTPFYEQADRWIRTWIYYDAANQQLSAWMADSVQGIIQVLNKAPYAFPPMGIVIWRLEYDTSQNTVDVANPLSRIWNRNVVVLRDLSYTTAQSLLSTVGL